MHTHLSASQSSWSYITCVAFTLDTYTHAHTPKRLAIIGEHTTFAVCTLGTYSRLTHTHTRTHFSASQSVWSCTTTATIYMCVTTVYYFRQQYIYIHACTRLRALQSLQSYTASAASTLDAYKHTHTHTQSHINAHTHTHTHTHTQVHTHTHAYALMHTHQSALQCL